MLLSQNKFARIIFVKNVTFIITSNIMYIVYNYSWLDLTYYKHEKSESKLIQLSSTIKIFFKINSNINIRILFTSCYACTFHFYFVMKYPIRKKKMAATARRKKLSFRVQSRLFVVNLKNKCDLICSPLLRLHLLFCFRYVYTRNT